MLRVKNSFKEACFDIIEAILSNDHLLLGCLKDREFIKKFQT